MRAACKGFRVLVGLGRSGSDAEIEKYETLLKTSQNLQKRTHEPSQARYSCHPVENQKSHLRVNLYVTITGGLQFFAIIISVKHTMQRLQSGLEFIWAIVWDGEMQSRVERSTETCIWCWLQSPLAAAPQSFLLSFLWCNATNGFAFHSNFFGQTNRFLYLLFRSRLYHGVSILPIALVRIHPWS